MKADGSWKPGIRSTNPKPGSKWVSSNEGLLVTGLGRLLICLELGLALESQPTALIVAPTSVCYNWARELSNVRFFVPLALSQMEADYGLYVGFETVGILLGFVSHLSSCLFLLFIASLTDVLSPLPSFSRSLLRYRKKSDPSGVQDGMVRYHHRRVRDRFGQDQRGEFSLFGRSFLSTRLSRSFVDLMLLSRPRSAYSFSIWTGESSSPTRFIESRIRGLRGRSTFTSFVSRRRRFPSLESSIFEVKD